MVISRKREAFAAGPDAISAQNSMAAVSADGSTVWVLMRRLKGVSKTWGDVLACLGLIGLADT